MRGTEWSTQAKVEQLVTEGAKVATLQPMLREYFWGAYPFLMKKNPDVSVTSGKKESAEWDLNDSSIVFPRHS